MVKSRMLVICALACTVAITGRLQAQTAPDGAALYAANCSSCHGSLASSSKRGRTAAQIQSAISANRGGMGSIGLTTAQIAAIASALSNTPAPTPGPTPGPTPTPAPVPANAQFVVIGWNDLGMHCYSPRFSEMGILPPYNNIQVAVIQKGASPKLVTGGLKVTYAMVNNLSVANKSDFWTYAYQMFGVNLAPGIGLTGNGLSGTMKTNEGLFEAIGVPALPLGDDMVWNPYQQAKATVTRADNGQTVGSATFVVPVSDEMNCALCHANGGVAARTMNNAMMEDNIITLHDQKHGTSLMASRPVLCASCHSDNALGTPGSPGIPSLSLAMHTRHSQVAQQPTCYNCHPGAKTQCSRSTLENMSRCENCHGNLTKVSADLKAGRKPWIEEPTCAQCHGPAYATNQPLYRKSTGHGGVYCITCHNSPHAWWPARLAVDNAQPQALQGSSRAIGRSCSVCHTDGRTGERPPHDVGAPTPSPTPGPTPTPTPGPTTDGAALYASNCAGCHGALASSSKRGRTASQIQSAISANRGGMGSLSRLTTAQIQAIATALSGAATPGPTPAPASDGAALYASYCTSCHGALASSRVRGSSASSIRSAISSVGQMNGLRSLTTAQTTAIAAALSGSGGSTSGGTTGRSRGGGD